MVLPISVEGQTCVLSCSDVPDSCDPMDGSLLGSSVCGILQAKIPEWVAVPSSRGSSLPRDQTQVSCFAGRFFTTGATWMGEARCSTKYPLRIIYLLALTLLHWERCAHISLQKAIRNDSLVMEEGTEEAARSPHCQHILRGVQSEISLLRG